MAIASHKTSRPISIYNEKGEFIERMGQEKALYIIQYTAPKERQQIGPYVPF